MTRRAAFRSKAQLADVGQGSAREYSAHGFAGQCIVSLVCGLAEKG